MFKKWLKTRVVRRPRAPLSCGTILPLLLILLAIAGTGVFFVQTPETLIFIHEETRVPPLVDSPEKSVQESQESMTPPKTETGLSQQEKNEEIEEDDTEKIIPPLENVRAGQAPQIISAQEITPSAPDPPLTPISEINAFVRERVVNIFCTENGEGRSRTVTGSGVIIDPRGVILTNAHLARSFLPPHQGDLSETSCAIRVGSPAQNRYTAELLYLSQTWAQNLAVLTDNPLALFSHDFALLRITGRTDSTQKLPESFPFLKFEVSNAFAEVDDAVVAVGYPAEFLGHATQLRGLHITSSATKIENFATPTGENTNALMFVGGSIATQKGMSGGAVVRQKSERLSGIVTGLRERSGAVETRDLVALTTERIDDNFQTELGFGLSQFLAQDTEHLAREFQENIAPRLSELLKDF